MSKLSVFLHKNHKYSCRPNQIMFKYYVNNLGGVGGGAHRALGLKYVLLKGKYATYCYQQADDGFIVGK